MSSVGALTCFSAAPARSGRPPRETTAEMRSPSSAAATSSRQQGSGGACAGAEIADANIAPGFLAHPACGFPQALREERDVEAQMTGAQLGGFLVRREQIEK